MGYKLIRNKNNNARFECTVLHNNKEDEYLTLFFNDEMLMCGDKIKLLFDEVLNGTKREASGMFNETYIIIHKEITKISICYGDSDTFDTKQLYELILEYIKMKNDDKIKNRIKKKQIFVIILCILTLILFIFLAAIYLKYNKNLIGFFCAISIVPITLRVQQQENKTKNKKHKRKMKVILDKNLYNNIWNKVYEKFKFQPSIDKNVKPFEFSVDYKVYKLMFVWNEKQEEIVNNIFKEMSNKDIYALDWHSDCFEFNPKSKIPLDYHYYDNNRKCEVYFPSYYPNGDYYFFISKDFSYGLLGHPWRKEIYVFGDKLIEKFEKHVEELELVKGIDENKTLLELCDIPDIKTNFDSYVVRTGESAIRKPLKELSTEEIRLLIGQRIGLKYLIPMALRILNVNILIGCQYYNGDLLATVLNLNEDDWKNNDINIEIFVSILNNSHIEVEKLKDEDEYDRDLFNKIQEFLQKHKPKVSGILEKNVDKNIVINNLNDIFNKLKKEYKVEWIRESKDAFYVYFSGDKKQYKIYVDNSLIGIYQKKKFLKFEYWSDLTHEHCDNDDDTFLDIYKVVMYYIKKYKKENIKREYKSLESFGREILTVGYTNAKNSDILSGFMLLDGTAFKDDIKKVFEDVLFGEKQSDSMSMNAYYIEIDKEITKIEELYPELDGANGGIFEWNTREIYELILEYYNKIDKFQQKQDIIKIYKEITRKKCYEMVFEEKEESGVLDSKLFGTPYLPIGEEYPLDKQEKPLTLLIQINFENIELENFPEKGILQVFFDAKKAKEHKILNSEFEIKYYEDISSNYQTEFPKAESFELFGYNKSVKLNLKEHYTWMPILNNKFEEKLKNTVNTYNEKMNANLTSEENGEIPMELFDAIYDECKKIPSLLLGGYSDYSRNLCGDGSECESKGKECLIKLVDNNFSQECINVIISQEDLINKKMDKAEVFYMW